MRKEALFTRRISASILTKRSSKTMSPSITFWAKSTPILKASYKVTLLSTT